MECYWMQNPGGLTVAYGGNKGLVSLVKFLEIFRIFRDLLDFAGTL